MTANHRNHRTKAKQIGIYIAACKTVFVNCKLYPVPFKAEACHKADYSDYIDNCRNINNKSRNEIKLFSKVKIRLGVHTVKNKKADKNVQQHKHAVK